MAIPARRPSWSPQRARLYAGGSGVSATFAGVKLYHRLGEERLKTITQALVDRTTTFLRAIAGGQRFERRFQAADLDAIWREHLPADQFPLAGEQCPI